MVERCLETILLTFHSRNWENTRLKLIFFSWHNINITLLWLILKWYTNLDDFFLLKSTRYHDDVKTTLKVWLVQFQDPDVRLISQIDIVMCFIYNILQCHGNIDGDVSPASLQYQNLNWEIETTSLMSFWCLFVNLEHTLHLALVFRLLILMR